LVLSCLWLLPFVEVALLLHLLLDVVGQGGEEVDTCNAYMIAKNIFPVIPFQLGIVCRNIGCVCNINAKVRIIFEIAKSSGTSSVYHWA